MLCFAVFYSLVFFRVGRTLLASPACFACLPRCFLICFVKFVVNIRGICRIVVIACSRVSRIPNTHSVCCVCVCVRCVVPDRFSLAYTHICKPIRRLRKHIGRLHRRLGSLHRYPGPPTALAWRANEERPSGSFNIVTFSSMMSGNISDICFLRLLNITNH